MSDAVTYEIGTHIEINTHTDASAKREANPLYSQISWTLVWQRELVAGLDVIQDLVVAEALVREAAKGDDLVHHHTERPDVRLEGEDTVHQALRRHPAHRQHACRHDTLID